MVPSVGVAGLPPQIVAGRAIGSWAVAVFLTTTTLLFAAIVIAGLGQPRHLATH